MKHLLTVLLALAVVFTFAACAGQNNNTSKTEESKADASTADTSKADEGSTVLADEGHALWVAHGQFLLADGTQNAWNGKSSDLYEKSALKAISLNDVKAINEELYNTLSSKEIKYLYTIDLIFGTNDATWSTNFLNTEGVLYKANGSYAFKIAQCNADVDGDTKVYAEDQWISDPHTAYAESLTPATVFYPVWQEEVDENGFSWASNPVVIGGAGLYTLVIAQYKTVSAAGTPGYGVGLVMKEAKEGIDYEEIKVFVPGDHTYGVIGNFEGSNWENDVAMTADGDNKWTAEVTLAKDNEFKVRADGAWDDSWGTNGYNGDNFKCEADGTYVVTITFDGDGNGTVTVEEKK